MSDTEQQTLAGATPAPMLDGFLADPADLSQLSIIDPQAVKDFETKQLNALEGTNLGKRKIVVAIGTGGTISMKTEDGIRAPHLGANAIFDQVHTALNQHFEICALEAFCFDSAQFTYRHVRDLAITMTHIWHNANVPFAGFLILHGTDTITYAGAVMSPMMGQGLPFSIVYTWPPSAPFRILSVMPAPISVTRFSLYLRYMTIIWQKSSASWASTRCSQHPRLKTATAMLMLCTPRSMSL